MRIVHFSGKAFSYGVEEKKLEGIILRVFDPAKTVADCFKYRNKIGLEVALEALRDCYRQRKATMDELFMAAKVPGGTGDTAIPRVSYMKKRVANLSASVRQRLLNLATERKEDFGLVLTRYGLERFLYRLSVSPHRDSFVLRVRCSCNSGPRRRIVQPEISICSREEYRISATGRSSPTCAHKRWKTMA